MILGLHWVVTLMAVMHLGPSQDRFYRIRREWPGHMPPTLFVSKPNRLWCNFKVLTGALVDESCSRPMRLMGRWQLVACDSHVWGNLHNQSKTWSYLKRRYSPMPPKGTIQHLFPLWGRKEQVWSSRMLARGGLIELHWFRIKLTYFTDLPWHYFFNSTNRLIPCLRTPSR